MSLAVFYIGQNRFIGRLSLKYRPIWMKFGRGLLLHGTCSFIYYGPAPRVGGIKRWCASDVRRPTSVAYIRPKSKTERPRKTKINTEVAHVTRDSDTTFKVKRSKVNLQGAGEYCGGLPHSLFIMTLDVYEWLRERTEHLDIFLFSRPSLNGVLFPMFCLLMEGECQI